MSPGKLQEVELKPASVFDRPLRVFAVLAHRIVLISKLSSPAHLKGMSKIIILGFLRSFGLSGARSSGTTMEPFFRVMIFHPFDIQFLLIDFYGF